MHYLYLQEVIKNCRKRQEEGDNPTTKANSIETLEDAVIDLANMLARIYETTKIAAYVETRKE